MEAEVYDNNIKCDWGKRKKKKKAQKFNWISLVPIKPATTTEGEKKKKNPKESTEQVKK